MAVNPPGRDELLTPSRSERTYTVTFGRTLVDGRAMDDGVTLPVDSPTLALLQQAATPLASNPVCEEYSATLVRADDSDGEYEQLLAVSLPRNVGFPEHAHLTTEVYVEVVEGSVVVERNGERRTLRAGESMIIKPGMAHSVRNESGAVASWLVKMRPAERLEATLTVLGGLAHDGKLSASGSLGLLQAVEFAVAVSGDTVFTSASPLLLKYATRAVAQLGRFLGSRTSESRYDDSFWIAHVEQPPEIRRTR